jgi:hypothetical protein
MSFFTFHTAMFLSATDSPLMIAAVSRALGEETRGEYVWMKAGAKSHKNLRGTNIDSSYCSLKPEYMFNL